MGGDNGQPYIYDRPTTYAYSGFNPRAATQAAQQAEYERNKPKAKQDGPLINFNAHPDSYMIVPGKNVNHKTMSRHTKKTVKVLRWTQLALRMVELIGAIGLMVCVVCLKGMQSSMSWIIRIAVRIFQYREYGFEDTNDVYSLHGILWLHCMLYITCVVDQQRARPRVRPAITSSRSSWTVD